VRHRRPRVRLPPSLLRAVDAVLYALQRGACAMRRVIIESPYAGDVERNLRYLRACMADCLARGEAPFASHGLYTQAGVLNDSDPEERALGIAAGFVWRDVADCTVVYEDFGVTDGMMAGVNDAEMKGRRVEWRRLGWAP
jgi:hypothetical protein